ncbi:Nudix hydrolase 15, mitochondrial [Zea mays]|uniref:Nudix hydrolase 15, mitochondrial n=1 Tax=Zea mays TaxID=4577 RepID=A0A3L6F6G0_MAIZE|nr:Nudix hydrolase 15, mitochondrial [Zea mays]
MAGEDCRSGAEMDALVRRLKLHRPSPSPYDPDPAAAPVPATAGDGELFRPRRAAVLVCLFRGDGGELRVILTKRSSSLSTHSGEVSLPGGKVEEGDADDVATALRESKEEIGLDPALVTVVASLEHFLSKYGLDHSHSFWVDMVKASRGRGTWLVTYWRFLHFGQAFKPALNIAEVDEIFDVPLEMFLKDENRTSEEREKMGQTFTVHYFTYENGIQKYLIWGLTARILIHAASVVYERPPDFTERRAHFKLPKFTKDCSSMLAGPAKH